MKTWTPAGLASASSLAMIRISSVPRPQLAPIKRTPISAIAVIACAGLTPIMVRKLVSKLKVAAIGIPGATS